MVHNLRSTVAVIGITALIAASAHAAVIAYEPYDYTAGANLTDLNGGTGWSGNWWAWRDEGGSGVITSPGTDDSRTTSEGLAVTVTGVTSKGNLYARYIDTSKASEMGYADVVANGKIGVAGKSIWTSYVIHPSAAGTTPWYVMHVFDQDAGELLYLVGKPGSESTWFIGDADTGISAVAEQTFLLVKTTWTESATTASLWVNPTNVGSEQDLGDASVTWSGSFTQMNEILTSVGGTTTSAVFDEIRLGTELQDVVSAPEPATLGLVALGGTLLLRRRRR